MRVWMYVDPSEAVRQCKSESGVLPLDLTDDDLQSLSEKQRDTLAECKNAIGHADAPSTGECIGYAEGIAEASVDTLKTVLDAIIAKKQAKVAEQQRRLAECVQAHADVIARGETVTNSRSVSCVVNGQTVYLTVPVTSIRWPYTANPFDPQIEAVRKSPAAVELKRQCERQNEAAKQAAIADEIERQKRKEADEAKKREAKAQWNDAVDAAVRQWGSVSQVERLDADLLGTDECLAIIRDHLFQSMDSFARYQRLNGSDVDHAPDCDSPRRYEFRVSDAAELTAREWESMKQLRTAAGDGVTVTPRLHECECDECGEIAVRMSAMARITWHGREFSREYALDD